jgi:signal transduction histidine kinase
MKSKSKWVILLIILSFLIGLFDYITGFEFDSFIFYFLPVLLSAWYLGRSYSLFFSFICALLWFVVLILTGPTYSKFYFSIWNTIARWITFVAIGWAASRIKVSLDTEREISNKLSESLIKREKTENALRELTTSLEQRVYEQTKAAKDKSEQLSKLAMELINAEEKERKRISEVLHDDLQQNLAAILINLRVIKNGHADLELDSVFHMLGETINTVRRLSHELSPVALHHSDLIHCLERLASQMNEKFGLKVEIRSEIDNQVDFSSTKIFICRAVQELMFNVVKHANVKSALATLTSTEKELNITIEDQGNGFDPDMLMLNREKLGLGLISIQERAHYFGGNFTITSSPGKGSRFTICLPISDEQKGHCV